MTTSTTTPLGDQSSAVQETQEMGIRQSEAKILSAEAEAEGVSSPSPEGQEEKEDVELPEKFRGKSVKDIVQSYQNLESLATRLAQKNAELKKAATTVPSYEPKPVKVTKEWLDKFYEKPEEAFGELITAIEDRVDKRYKAKETELESKSKQKLIELEAESTKEYLRSNYAHLLTPDKAPLLDSIADDAPGDTLMAKYQYAAKQLDSILMSERKRSEQQFMETKQQVEDMKKSAATPDSTAIKGTSYRKVYKQSEVDRLILKGGPEWVKFQPEYIKALKEGRVIKDI
ncbi:MAG: hypothetical protein ABIL14_01420 [candidate division WOR-3 bacterium]